MKGFIKERNMKDLFIIFIFSSVTSLYAQQQPDTLCTKEYNPICGQKKGKKPETFLNQCYMNIANAEFLHAGRCEPSEEIVELGVLIGPSEKNGVVVLEVLPGSPAAMAGLMVGDEIVKINYTPVAYLDFMEVVEELRGKVDSEVGLIFYRKGKIKSVNLTREVLNINV